MIFLPPTGIDMQGRNGCWRICAKQHNGCKNLLEIIPPNIIVSWNDLGDVYQMKNNKAEAIRCYKQALKLRPGNQRAKENLERLNK